MRLERQPPILATLAPSNHPYLNCAWTPLHEEVDAWDLEVIEGAIPSDIDGVYLRNTENQVHQPLGRYHPFDGDGMICQISFQGGRADYRNRFVRTRGFLAEQEARGSLWGGLADPVSVSKRPGFGAHGFLKDSSSTDVVVHAGQALSTFYQCGEGYRLDPMTLETLGVEAWVPIDGVSAHPKIDEATGTMPPPAKPCMMRNSSSNCRVHAMPHSTELAVNSARQIKKKALRPIVLVRNALAVKMMALATR